MLSISALSEAISGARLRLPHPSAGEKQFISVSTDSRTISQGGLFVALSGPNFDGHDFIATAFARGAAAVICERESAVDSTQPAVIVADALLALQQLAAYWRTQWHGRLIAVTGSNGKTTVKQMIACILAAENGEQNYWATPGNLNNHIGLPLSVLGLRAEHRMAVLELGMNHPGEIALLSAIAKPTVALVNNAQREHQEFMKSVMAVALENGEVFKNLTPEGVAVYPRDEHHESVWASLAKGHQQIRFDFLDDGKAQDALGAGTDRIAKLIAKEMSLTEVLAVHRASQAEGVLCISLPNGQSVDVNLRALGRHAYLNAAAAAACAYAAGCSSQSIASGLNAFTAVKGRGASQLLAGGGLLVDDSYNANPDSVRAAIDALTRLPRPHALVLGDMGEVGDQGQAFHEEVLRHAQSCDLRSIWLLGDAMGRAQKATGIGRHFEEIGSLIADIRQWLTARQAERTAASIWVKGSRFMKMERVVQALTNNHLEAQPCS